MAPERNEELKGSNYELFILALSLLSLVNWVGYFVAQDQAIIRVLFIIDLLLSLIFLADFTYRLRSASSGRNYFLRQAGWLDLLGSLPFPQAKIARLGRVVRALRLMREYGLKSMLRDFVRDRADTAVYTVSFLIILILEFGSVGILYFELPAPNANITTADDAIWWAIVTISTVGYGDQYPVTLPGRLVGVVVIVVGVALFGVIAGFLANFFLEPTDDEKAADPAALLAELERLRQEQARAYGELNARLEGLAALLDTPASSARGTEA